MNDTFSTYVQQKHIFLMLFLHCMRWNAHAIDKDEECVVRIGDDDKVITKIKIGMTIRLHLLTME